MINDVSAAVPPGPQRTDQSGRLLVGSIAKRMSPTRMAPSARS